MKISDILKPECIISNIKATTKTDVLTELARPIAQEYHLNLDEVVTILLNREKLGSTGIGEGVAIPHGKIHGIKNIVASIGISAQGLKYDALDDKPCNIFFLLLAPSNCISEHLKALARASMLLKNPTLRESLIRSKTNQELYQIISKNDNNLDE